MTDTTEKVILSVEIDQSEALKKSAALSKEIKDLTEANKALAKSGKETSVEYQENARLAKSLTDEKRNLDRQIDLSVKAFNSETGSIKQLRAEVSILTDRYNSLSAEERDNSAVGKDLQSTIKAKTDRLKELEGAIGDNRRNVGNYRDVLRDLTGQIQINGQNMDTYIRIYHQAKDAVGGAGIQVQSFNGVLKASAIGVVITLVAGLIATFLKFKPVADQVEQVFSGINAAVNAVIGSLINVGNGLIKIAKGEFSQGIDEIRHSFDGLGDSIKTAYNAGVEFAAIQQDIDDINRQNRITNSQLNKEIDQLILKSRNRTLSEKQRLLLLDEASKREKQALANSLNAANKELELAQKKYDEAVRTKQLNDQIEDARVDAIVKINELESQSINLQEKISNRRDALIQEEIQARAKLREEQEKLLKQTQEDYEFYQNLSKQLREKEFADEFESLENASKAKVGLSEQEANDLLAIRQLTNEEIAELALLSRDQQIKYIEEIKNKAIAAEIMKRDAAVITAQSVVGALQAMNSFAGENAEFGKSLAIAEATINTYAAIVGALRANSTIPIPGFAIAQAIATGVQGFAQIAKIAATDIPSGVSAAAGGGSFMTKGPTMLLVGDNPGGVERVDVTPLSGRGQTRISPNGNLVAMAGGGSLVTGFGGFAERNSSKSTIIDYKELASELAKVKIYTQITEINRVNAKKAAVAKVSEL